MNPQINSLTRRDYEEYTPASCTIPENADYAQMAALARWYVVEAEYKQALLAHQYIKLAGIASYLAQKTVLVRPRTNGVQATTFIQVLKPIFHQYVFVSFADDAYGPLLRCKGVKRLICGAGGVPKPVARGEVERLIAEEPERHQDRRPKAKAAKEKTPWLDLSAAEIVLRQKVR